MEHIYVATSPQFEGIVKIGRTDREVETRMKELDGYGLEAFEGESSWITDENHILLVENNTVAETLLHQHFADVRVSQSRELFFAPDPKLIVDEALEITGGQILADITDSDLYGSVIEEVVEWGVTIAGALTVGAVGMVLANKLHSKFKNTQQYQDAVQRGKNLIAEHQQAIQTIYKQPKNFLGSVAVKAKDSFQWAVSGIKNGREAKSTQRGNENSYTKPISKFRKRAKKDKYLIGSFSSAQKARAFVNRDPKLIVQRISHQKFELWGVYILKNSY